MSDRPKPNWTETFKTPAMDQNENGPRDPDHGIMQMTSPIEPEGDNDGPKGVYRPSGSYIRSPLSRVSAF